MEIGLFKDVECVCVYITVYYIHSNYPTSREGFHRRITFWHQFWSCHFSQSSCTNQGLFLHAEPCSQPPFHGLPRKGNSAARGTWPGLCVDRAGELHDGAGFGGSGSFGRDLSGEYNSGQQGSRVAMLCAAVVW